MTKCGKCGGMIFRFQESKTIQGTDLVWNFVQCAMCSTPVAVMDYFSHGGVMNTLEKLTKQVAALRQQVANVDHNIALIGNRLGG